MFLLSEKEVFRCQAQPLSKKITTAKSWEVGKPTPTTPEGEAAANAVHDTTQLIHIFYLLQHSIWYLRVSKFHLTPQMMGRSLHTHIQITVSLPRIR